MEYVRLLCPGALQIANVAQMLGLKKSQTRMGTVEWEGAHCTRKISEVHECTTTERKGHLRAIQNL